MKRSLVVGGGAVLAIVAAVGIGALVLLSNVGALVKAAVENYGSEAFQSKVTLASADISLKSGEGQLKGLVVGNPKGFATASALKAGEIKVTLDTARTTKDTIVLKEILIVAPAVTYEMAAGGSNFDVLQRNAQAYAKRIGAGGAKKDEKKGEGPKLIIDNLYIRQGLVGVSHAILQGKQLDVPLPTIHLKDIGKEKKGATPEEVAERVMTSITRGAQGAVATLNLDKMLSEAASAAKSAADRAAGAAEGAVKKLFGK